MADVALGFVTHSGWAAVVGVVEARPGFRVVLRERVEMTDPRAPESKQPYHAVERLPVGVAAERLAAWAEAAEKRATDALDEMLSRLERAGHRPVGAGILDARGRKGSSLETTLASHALIHTADGAHFRAAIAGAAARLGLPVVRVAAGALPAQTAAAAGEPAEAVAARLKSAGRALGPPWAADQKTAAMLAWLVLRSGGRSALP